MKTVFKFGGASIKDILEIKNVVNILKKEDQSSLIIVFSAMGKVTNMLEEIVSLYTKGDIEESLKRLDFIKKDHYRLLKELFSEEHEIYNTINNLFVQIEWILSSEYMYNYDYTYDQIVCTGELLSTHIMSDYLNSIGYSNIFLDARDLIRTNNDYRFAKIDWDQTDLSIRKHIQNNKRYITQGFIGGTSENFTTTLGREGSDFTAAILGYVLDVEEVVVWKDVPGIMNADPDFFDSSKQLKSIPFEEAIELAFYGAKVIHPKTIQPLQAKKIPLRVKSFIEPNRKGTIISEVSKINPFLPFYIVKDNQILISISDPLLSFVVEEHLSTIFSIFSEYNIRVNMMQNSAVSFSICVDNDQTKTPLIIDKLKKDFKVKYNTGLILHTIRHYNNDAVKKVAEGKTILLEQKTRNTIHLVLDNS